MIVTTLPSRKGVSEHENPRSSAPFYGEVGIGSKALGVRARVVSATFVREPDYLIGYM